MYPEKEEKNRTSPFKGEEITPPSLIHHPSFVISFIAIPSVICHF
jgi:hypothetical protein